MINVDATRWESIESLYADLQSETVTASRVLDWLRQWSDLYKAVLEARASLKAAAIRHPDDEAGRAAFAKCQEEVMPRWMAAKQSLTDKFLAIDGFQPGPDHREMMRRFQNQAGLFTEESIPLEKELSEIEAHWGQIFQRIRARIGGDDISLAQAKARLEDLDRDNREAAWRGMNEAWLQKREVIGELLVRALRTRRQLADIAGTPNYLSYRWRELDRLDYSPADVARFGDAVRDEIVPLSSQLLRARRRRLNLESVRPWDLAVDRDLRPPLKPFSIAHELEEGIARTLSHVDHEIGGLFERMRNGWLDLDPSPGKPAGGEEWVFPQSGMPYIVANAVGTHTNVLIVLHESGHAAHDFISRQHNDLIWNGGGPTEFEELAASAMVFLADPYLVRNYGGFYSADEAEQGRTANIEYYVHFLRQVAMVDAFERWLYSVDPDAITLAALEGTWLDLSRAFDPDVDWAGLEQARMGGWLRFSYFYFLNPCYYITYGLSLLGAFEIWQRAREDQVGALRAYKGALVLGDTQPFPILYRSAGAELPFGRHTIQDTARFIDAQFAGRCSGAK